MKQLGGILCSVYACISKFYFLWDMYVNIFVECLCSLKNNFTNHPFAFSKCSPSSYRISEVDFIANLHLSRVIYVCRKKCLSKQFTLLAEMPLKKLLMYYLLTLLSDYCMIWKNHSTQISTSLIPCCNIKERHLLLTISGIMPI